MNNKALATELDSSDVSLENVLKMFICMKNNDLITEPLPDTLVKSIIARITLDKTDPNNVTPYKVALSNFIHDKEHLEYTITNKRCSR